MKGTVADRRTSPACLAETARRPSPPPGEAGAPRPAVPACAGGAGTADDTLGTRLGAKGLWRAAAVRYGLVLVLACPAPAMAQPHPLDPPDPAPAPMTSDPFIDMTAPPPVPPLLDEARALVGAQKYPEAIDAFHRYLQTAPEDRQARLELARVQAWTKHYPEAIALYDRLLDEDASDPAFRLERARVLLWAEHYVDGLGALRGLRAELRAALDREPEAAHNGPQSPARVDPAPHETQPAGKADPAPHETQPPGKADPAPHETQPTGKADPAPHETQPTGKADPAQHDVPQPGRAATLELLEALTRAMADGLAWSGDASAAAVEYGTLVLEHPRDAPLRLSLARALRDSTALEPALEQYAAYLRLRPDDTAVALERARALLWNARYAEAIQALTALQSRPGLRDEVDRQLYQALLWSNQLDEALPVLEALRVRHPEDASLTLEHARAMVRKRLPAAARASYALYVALGGNCAVAAFEQAQLFLWEGDPLRARRLYRKALPSMPHQALDALQALEPSLLSMTPLVLQLRADVAGFLQESLSARTEIPVGLVWLGPQLELDRFSGTRLEVPVWRAAVSARARYRHNARLELEGALGIQDTRLSGGASISPKLALEARWRSTSAPMPARPAQLELKLDYSDAMGALFTRAALEAEIRQLEGSLTASLPAGSDWQVWGQARAAHLFDPGGATNNLFQLQGSLGRRISPSDGPGLELALTGGALHFTRDLTTGEATGDPATRQTRQTTGEATGDPATGDPATRQTRQTTGEATGDPTGASPPVYWAPAYYLTGGLRLGLTMSPLDGMTLQARVRAGLAASSEVSDPFPEISGEVAIDHRVHDRLGWRGTIGYGQTVRTNSYWSALGMLEGWYRF